MAKYIDAAEADNVLNDLLADIDDYVLEEGKSEQYANGFADGVSAAIEKLDTLIPADVEPVRHGKWVERTNYYTDWLECSECGRVFTDIWHPPKFCDKCGAKMDGKGGG